MLRSSAHTSALPSALDVVDATPELGGLTRTHMRDAWRTTRATFEWGVADVPRAARRGAYW
jgi:hypothetical protein